MLPSENSFSLPRSAGMAVIGDPWILRGRSVGVSKSLEEIRKRSLLINLVMVAAFVLLWFLIDAPRAVMFAGGLIYLIGCPLIAVNESRATPVLISPLSWWFSWQTLTLGLSPIWIGLNLGDLTSLDYVGQEVSMDNVVQGFLYYAIGSLALHYGLQRGRPKERAGAQSRGASESMLAIILLSVAGIAMCYLGTRVSAVGTLGWLETGALSAACSLAIAPPRILVRGSPLHWGAVFVAVVACAIAHAMVGLKFMFMLTALPVLWIFLLSKQLRKTLVVLVPALVLSYLYIVSPIVENLRNINHSANIRDSLVTGAEAGTLGEVASSYESSTLQRIDSVAERSFYGIYVAYLVQDARANGFKYGQTLEYLLYAFIPRILWPEKPNVSRGAWYSAELGAAESEETANTASALTAEGELYWNFGLAGMIAGMAALGWLIGRTLWAIAGTDPRANPICMLALLTAVLLVAGELEAGTMFVAVVADTIGLRVLAKAYEMFESESASA